MFLRRILIVRFCSRRKAICRVPFSNLVPLCVTLKIGGPAIGRAGGELQHVRLWSEASIGGLHPAHLFHRIRHRRASEPGDELR